jgi:hypothetical protein
VDAPSAAPTLPPDPPAYVYAANDERPRGPVEQELCDRASTTDWLYMGGSVASFAFSVYADLHWFQFSNQPGVRTIGPALVGTTWGFTLGGGYLAQPKCSGFVKSAPPEGDVRTSWHLALALAGLAAISAPMIEYWGLYNFGDGVPLDWSVSERRLRLFAAAGGAFGGALLPYLLPPKTWRAAKELERIRLGTDARGSWVSYTVRF